jgi:hypothetical protein
MAELQEKQVPRRDIKRKCQHRCQKVYLAPVQGIWFRGFRKREVARHPREIYKLSRQV